MSKALKEDYQLCAAIDFGTTFCGVLCSLKKSPHNIWAKNDNKGENATSLQEPTTVLLNPDRTFFKFGHEAEKEYKKLVLHNEHEDYFFFQRFKMKLHSQRELTKYAQIEDNGGKQFDAIKLFTMAIKHLKDGMIKKLASSELCSIKEEEIRWVITVPAIWTEAAKQYMRYAANEAGIPDSQLLLGLEPEVAAVHSKELFVKRGDADLKTFNPGSRYMVLDLGGGTVDVTMQMVLQDGSLRELKSASGGAWGGLGINNHFFDFLAKVFGKENFEDFKRNNLKDYFELEENFEREKRSMKIGEENTMIITLPQDLLDRYQKSVGRPPSAAGKRTAFEGDFSITKNTLEVKNNLIAKFFESTLKTIVGHVRDIFSQPEAENVGNILMVGGFSESSVVQERINREFPGKRVMVPHEAGSAVLKGAVLFGHNPSIISARVCPYTYGLQTRKPFNPDQHPAHRKKTVNRNDVVDGVFDKHLEIGQTVYVAEPLKQHLFYAIDSSNPKVFWNVYKSTSKYPKFCDEKECEHIGKLEVTLRQSQSGTGRRQLGVRMICRGTELEAEAIDKATNESVIATFNFLK